MSPLKLQIFDQIRKSGDEAGLLTDSDMNLLLFRNPDCMRLTLSGFMSIKEIFTAYSFPLPDEIKAKHLIGLSHMEFPYFLTVKRLVLFSEMDAMAIQLHGDLLGFLAVYSK